MCEVLFFMDLEYLCVFSRNVRCGFVVVVV